MTLPTMFEMRMAASMPRGRLRSTFFWAPSIDGMKSNTATLSASARARRLRFHAVPPVSAATSHLRGAAQQIDFLAVGAGQHFDERLVGGIARERVSRLEDRFVDGAQARLELCHGFRRQRRFLLIEHVLQHGD